MLHLPSALVILTSTSRRTHLVLGLSLLAGTLACRAPEGDESTGFAATDIVDDGEQDPCPDRGRSCECGEFLESTLACVDDEEICDCAACPAFDPGPGDFVACGGDVWGTWRLVEARGRGSLVYFSSVFSTEVTECEAMTEAGEGEREILLQFFEGGWVDVVVRESFDEHTRFTSDCAPVQCESIVLRTQSPFDTSSVESTGTCSTTGCGLCECTAYLGNDTEGSSSWTILDDGRIQIEDLAAYAFESCASADQLVLSAPGSVYTFERTEITGTPLACEARTGETCETSPECERGACVGTGSCEGAGESACPTYPGCIWDDEVCSGDAPAECQLADVGVVPGCE